MMALAWLATVPRLLQRKCACDSTTSFGEECAECSTKQLNSSGQSLNPAPREFLESRFGRNFSQVRIQPCTQRVVPGDLTVGPADDHYERESERASEAVTRTPAPDSTPTTRLHNGFDFSQVRVHTDAQAAEAARDGNALAYTIGRDIVFGLGQYAPGTSQGRRLLTHELAHVAQQGNRVQSPPLTMQRQQQQPRTRVTLSTEGQCIDGCAIAETIPGARVMANTAFSWFLSLNSRDRARVNLLLHANFLSDSEDIFETVKSRVLIIRERLEAAQNAQVTFVCEPATDPECGDPTGYVLGIERNRIHICPPFFNLTPEGDAGCSSTSARTWLEPCAYPNTTGPSSAPWVKANAGKSLRHSQRVRRWTPPTIMLV